MKPGAIFAFIGIFVLVPFSFAQLHLERYISLTPPYDGFAPQAPVALTLSPEDQLYLLDARLAAIAKLTSDGHLSNQIGGPGSGQKQFYDPADLSIYSGLDLFVADRGNDRIVRLDRNLNYLSEFSSLSGTATDLSFEKPLSVLQGARGDLFIAEGGNDRILKIAPDGAPLFSFGVYGEARGALYQPRRLEPDPLSGIWVLDQRGHLVHFDEYGGFIEELQAPQSTNAIMGLAVSAGQIWICADSCLWAWDRSQRTWKTFACLEIGLSETAVLVDLAYRANSLWLLDERGNLTCYTVRDEP